MGGQASHFLRYAPAGQDYAIRRYTKELERLLTVLERRLAKSAYVAGNDYTIADMAIWPGRASAFVMGMGLRSEEHKYELQSLMRISNAVFCLNKKTTLNLSQLVLSSQTEYNK